MTRFISVTLLFIFLGCSRFEEPRQWAVNYQVVILSGVGSYKVDYINESGANNQVGGITSSWVSPTLGDYDAGKRVRILVTRTSGDCVLEVSILRNTGIHETDVLERSNTEIELVDII